ncbi:leucine-rich repeat domain-containing protein, partial [Salmonella enterica subsp. enterica serovar Typhimurium]|uniref:leucine-rich repeat protein n=1 Tax=Salmonella enterica TaxID=28901 RepID=UPI0020A567D6
RMLGQLCGDNLTWTLRQGTLTISGTGPMTDFNPYQFSEEPAPPWMDEYITSIVIEDGVTSIGAYAFWRCKYLTDVQIPASVTGIGNNAFW